MEEKKRHLITRPIVCKILKEKLPPLAVYKIVSSRYKLQQLMEWKPSQPNAEADESDE